MAPKPRNYDWLNVSSAFVPAFGWKNGLKVLGLLNFTMLVGFTGFAAQILFGIPALIGEVRQEALLSDYDLTLIYLATMALLTLWMVRLRISVLASALLLGIAFLVGFKFFELFNSNEVPVFVSQVDLILLPITLTLGLLIVATYLWAALQVWQSSDR